MEGKLIDLNDGGFKAEHVPHNHTLVVFIISYMYVTRNPSEGTSTHT